MKNKVNVSKKNIQFYKFQIIQSIYNCNIAAYGKIYIVPKPDKTKVY